MGVSEKIIFLGILGMGAIVGVIAYTLFMPHIPVDGETNSVYRKELPAKTSEPIQEKPKLDPSSTKADVTLTILDGSATQGNPDYDPEELVVKKGSIIKVDNADPVPHTVTNGEGPSDETSGKVFDTGIIMGEEAGILETDNIEVGEYTYYCTVHPYMTGTLKIE